MMYGKQSTTRIRASDRKVAQLTKTLESYMDPWHKHMA